jgi:aquaporin Z
MVEPAVARLAEAKLQAREFQDRTLEGRRIFAEMWGTFLLVLVAAGATVVSARSHGAVTLAMAVVAPGLMVMTIIYFMGAVSGAHLNPAVTLAFALRRNFPWYRVPGYIVAQFAGGIAAALFLRGMFGLAGQAGATIPDPSLGAGKAFVMEVVLTAGLVNAILGTASGARNIGTNGAIAVGGYIALAGLWFTFSGRCSELQSASPSKRYSRGRLRSRAAERPKACWTATKTICANVRE